SVAVTGAPEPGHEAPCLAAVDLHARESGIGGEGIEVDRPVVDVEAAAVEQPGEMRLPVVLGIAATDARDAHELAGSGDELGRHRLDLGQHPLDDRHGAECKARCRTPAAGTPPCTSGG